MNILHIAKLVADNTTNNNINGGGPVTRAIDTVDGGNGPGDLAEAVKTIINGIVAALGIVCVIVVIIGGINYMTSTGDAGKVEKAKKTILYGVIGMVICALAFAIVNFVIVKILQA